MRLKEKQWKFQLMILGKKNRLKYSLKIGSITVKESDEVELLGITIDKAFNFKKHIEHFCPVQAWCFKANQKLLDCR